MAEGAQKLKAFQELRDQRKNQLHMYQDFQASRFITGPVLKRVMVIQLERSISDPQVDNKFIADGMRFRAGWFCSVFERGEMENGFEAS